MDDAAASVGRAPLAWVAANARPPPAVDEPCLGLVMIDADRSLLDVAYAGDSDRAQHASQATCRNASSRGSSWLEPRGMPDQSLLHGSLTATLP